MVNFKSDKYRLRRGGYSRFLHVKCSNCEHTVCLYQKDGPGPLKRMYADRIHGTKATTSRLRCSKCKSQIGTRYIYEKESRPAYLVADGTVTKQVVSVALARKLLKSATE